MFIGEYMAESLIQIKIQADTAQATASIKDFAGQMSAQFDTAKKSLEGLNNGAAPDKVRSVYKQIEKLKEDHNRSMGQLDKQMTLENHAAAQAMAQSFNTAIDEMLLSSRSFSADLQNLWQRLGNTFSGIASTMVSDWIAALAAKEDYSVLQDLKEITRTAYTAAAHAYNAVVGIPIIGPELAPAAAAVTFAAVEAFGGGVNSAAGGWDVVPQDQLAMLHKNEMVLPASLADSVRRMSGGGDVHMSFGGNTFHGGDTRSFEQLLYAHANHISRILRNQLRKRAFQY